MSSTIPAPFQIQPERRRGLRPNRDLKASRGCRTGTSWPGLEQPLFEDGKRRHSGAPAAAGWSSSCRRTEAWHGGREWTYQIEATPRLAGYEVTCGDGGGTGLVELLALYRHDLLSLERSVRAESGDQSRHQPDSDLLRDARRDRGAQDACARSRHAALHVCRAELRNLDNFEGMSFGPPGPDGGATLLFVSDDNFRKTQRTSFLLFSIDGRAGR